MNKTSGIFTAPRAGTYTFAFAGVMVIPHTGKPESDNIPYLLVRMILNNNLMIAEGIADDFINGGWDSRETLSFQSTINLQAGDEIFLMYFADLPSIYLSYTHFSGWLLEENLSQSLK